MLLRAQTMPAEGSKLNYTLVGFSIPANTKAAAGYTFEIAKGTYNNVEHFKSHIIITRHSKDTKTIIELPSFGTDYTWRIVTDSNNKIQKLYHFSTLTSPLVDNTKFRLRIIQKAKAHKDAYIFSDGNKVLYNMLGKPVWFLPDIPGIFKYDQSLRDLKMTPQGTITFQFANNDYEVSYDGKLIWKTDLTDSSLGYHITTYHHEFTRLANGHYLLLGDEMIQLPLKKWDTLQNKRPKESQFGIILEYDANNKLLWKWRSAPYFINEFASLDNSELEKANWHTHDNSLYFDEKNKTMYMGCKDVSSILKISYPEGKIIARYGEKLKQTDMGTGDGLFCKQHSARTNSKGELYLYSNNICKPQTIPTLVVMKEPTNPKDTLETVWEFTCDMDSNCHKSGFPSGGTLFELKDGSFLASMGSNYGIAFIVNRKKEVLWSALPEKTMPNNPEWQPMTEQYKVSIIDNQQALEKLIWAKPKLLTPKQ